MNRISMRRASAYAGVLVAALALAPSAFAHAELFPNQIPSGDGYLLNLAVPNEKENASTTQIQITMPADFDLEHVAPVPGWTATVAGQHMVERRDGGRQLDHLEGQARAAPSSPCCRSPACPRRRRTYAFTVRQTYSDGSVVDVVGRRELGHAGGARHGDRRGEHARAAARTRARRSPSSRSSSAAWGCSSAAPRSSPGGARHEDRRAGGRAARRPAVALALPAVAWGHASLLATQPQASGVLSQPPTQVRLTYSERIEPRFAVISVTDAAGQPGDGRQPGARARRREHDLRQAAPSPPGLVPRLVARDLGRRAPRARRVHVRRRAEPGPAAAVRDPLARGERGDAQPGRLSLGAAARAAGGRRPARVPRRDRAAAAGDGRQRARPARRHARGRASRWRSPWSPRPSTSCSRPPSSR